MEIKAREIYKVDTISKGNDLAWDTIKKAIDTVRKSGETGQIVIDFTGVTLLEPWANPSFRRLMADRSIVLHLYNSEESASHIRMMCIAGELGNNRVINTTVEIPPEPTKNEIKQEEMAQAWVNLIVQTSVDKAEFNIYQKVDQIGSDKTVRYIWRAIEMHHQVNQSVTEYTINTSDMIVSDHLLKMISEKIVASKKELGIDIQLLSTNKETMNNAKINSVILVRGPYKRLRKVTDVKQNMRPGYAGLLMQYVKTRGLDRLGRRGDGAILSCVPAIYRGIKYVSGSALLQFDVFDLEHFYTKVHWALEHDNEEPEPLQFKPLSIPIDDCGIYGLFLGHSYHFSEPLQYENSLEGGLSDMMRIHNNSVVHQLVTIPERMRDVFDNWGIDYNKEYLNKCVRRTIINMRTNSGLLGEQPRP